MASNAAAHLRLDHDSGPATADCGASGGWLETDPSKVTCGPCKAAVQRAQDLVTNHAGAGTTSHYATGLEKTAYSDGSSKIVAGFLGGARIVFHVAASEADCEDAAVTSVQTA